MIKITTDENGKLKSLHIPHEVLEAKTTIEELSKLDFIGKEDWIKRAAMLEDKHEERKLLKSKK